MSGNPIRLQALNITVGKPKKQAPKPLSQPWKTPIRVENRANRYSLSASKKNNQPTGTDGKSVSHFNQNRFQEQETTVA